MDVCRGRWLSSCTIAATLLLMTSPIACSRGTKPVIERTTRTGEYHVSVYSAGNEVKDFGDRLVHYVTLSPADVEKLISDKGEAILPFDGIMEVDHKGQPSGFRIEQAFDRGRTERLGFREDDIVTAIGRTRSTSIADMDKFVQALRENREETITIIRDGQPHKLLYSVRE